MFREADVLPGYPQPLHAYGQGVPAHKIDTAIWWEPNGHTYFFSGDRYTLHYRCMQRDLYTVNDYMRNVDND